jgi:flagella basal body P-ring formation protein FlgA
MIRCFYIAMLLGLLLPATGLAAESAVVEARMRAALEDALPWPDARLRVTDVRVVGELSGEDWDLRLRDPDDFVGRVQAEVVSANAGSRVWVQARVHVEVPVWVTTRRVIAGKPVSTAVTRSFRPLGRLPRGFFTEKSQFDASVAKTGLAAGQVLSRSSVDPPMAVRRSQPVRLVVQRGSATATDRGIALSSAREGGVVRVRSATTDSILTGIARPGGVVEVP